MVIVLIRTKWLFSLFNLILEIIFNKTKNDIDYYLQLLESFVGLVILTNILIFILFIYLICTNSTNFEVVSNILNAICNQTSEIIANNRKFIAYYKDDIRLWLFIAYFVSSIYLDIKKSFRIFNYTTVKIIGVLYLPFMLGILFFIPAIAYVIIYVDTMLKNVLFLLLSIFILSIMFLSNEINNIYKKIMSNYVSIESFWKKLIDNQNNNFKNVINEIYTKGISLHLFLWSSAIMLLIMSFLSCYTFVIYIFLLSFILYLHWAVAVFFKPIYKIEELTIIGENKTIKNAYLIEKTDKEYTIIIKTFLKTLS